MKKHLVFDYGNVLVRWSPRHIVTESGYTGEDAALLEKAVFDPDRWELNDSGSVLLTEYAEKTCALVPARLHDAVRDLVAHWQEHLPPIDGMEALVRKYKAKGYGIYLISNIAQEFADHTHLIPAMDCFDGLVLSGLEKITKPSVEIFRRFLQRFDLDAADCLFIDDRTVNLEGAAQCGIATYLFDGDAQALDAYLESQV